MKPISRYLMLLSLVVLLTAALCHPLQGYCQTVVIRQTKEFIPPADSTATTALKLSLSGFIGQLSKPNKENSFVNPAQLPETSALMDEMKDMGVKPERKDRDYYKPTLLEAVKIEDSVYLVQLGFLGGDSTGTELRAIFRLRATRTVGAFEFGSPLRQNTASWTSETFGKTTVYFQGALNRPNAKKYFEMVDSYDKRLNASTVATGFYCCDNFPAAMQLLGIDYKRDYNGYAKAGLSSAEHSRHVEIDGSMSADFGRFDPHDLWHDRLHKVLSTDSINRPVDEGTAYLYGGSWGYSWPVVLAKFQAYARANPKSDWLTIYNNNSVFDSSGGFPFISAYVINALIAQKLEKEKGFPAVMQLLRCGKRQKENDNYFTALEKLTGTRKQDFNKMVRELIKNSTQTQTR